MWQSCCAYLCDNTEIKYNISDNFFEIKCGSDSPKINSNTRLYAVFSNEFKFEIGFFGRADNIWLIDKKYSLSYLENNNIDIHHLESFIIENSENEAFTATIEKTQKEDTSITRAKELLGSIKKEKNPQMAADAVSNIKKRTSLYTQENIPVLNGFTWFKINKNGEFFNLSSIEHLLHSEGFVHHLINGTCWYLGVCNEDRIYAVGCILNENFSNPFTNASDCVSSFALTNTNERFYAVGIMVLDDGQYFCSLT